MPYPAYDANQLFTITFYLISFRNREFT